MIKFKLIKKILTTGGAGFIGLHVLRQFVTNYPNYHTYNFDALNYDGNLENKERLENVTSGEYMTHYQKQYIY